MHLVHNERTRLTANLFNALATALITAGVFAPAAAMAYGISDLRIGKGLGVTTVCALGAATLHWIGRRTLRRLRE